MCGIESTEKRALEKVLPYGRIQLSPRTGDGIFSSRKQVHILHTVRKCSLQYAGHLPTDM